MRQNASKTCGSLALLAFFVLPLTLDASPLSIPAGFDHFQTFTAGTQFGLALPAGFINLGGQLSDPFGPASIFFTGHPPGLPSFPLTPILVPTGPGCHLHSAGGTHCNLAPLAPANADTVVERLNSLTLNNIGDAGIINTELVGLSLISATPILMTFSGGGFSELFNVYVTLNGAQNPGSMLVTRTGDSSVQFQTLTAMGANVTFSFERVLDSSIVQTLNVDGAIQLREPWEFTTVPEPATFLLLVFALPIVIAGRKRLRYIHARTVPTLTPVPVEQGNRRFQQGWDRDSQSENSEN